MSAPAKPRVRRFTPADAPKLAHIFLSAVQQIGRRYYSDEQVNAWAPCIPDPDGFVARASDGRSTWIATDQRDVPLAFGDLEPNGHIDLLYCRPDVAGTGVTVVLYEYIEQAALTQGIELLFVEASEPARRFFEKQGFRVTSRRDFKLGGVAMHNFRMEKCLHA